MIKIEIDGKALEVQNGTTIIQAADAADIYIPRFCYHKKLHVAANCRMCLVEVEKMGKPQPACATPVGEGMKIFTKSAKALQAQKAVMEFLLINHPLDCPICDQGGQCELQDLAMGFGADVSKYNEAKRAVPDPDLGPFVATDMTRCIACTRCVRFGQEIAGMPELGGMNRGEHLSITTYVKQTLQSELSGNIIDICPVGALTSKPFRFQARAWELQQIPGIAPHDCIGSHVHLGFLRNQLLRVNPREDESLNEVWIADRDRFGYAGVHSKMRATKPMLKENGEWKMVDWTTAFDFVVNYLRQATAQDPNQVGVIASHSATMEELYLLQKFARGLGVNNIDHRLQQTDFSSELEPFFNLKIADIPQSDAILLVGSYIRHEQPIAGMKVRQASLRGAKVCSIQSLYYDWNFAMTHEAVVAPDHMVQTLAALVKAYAQISGKTHDVLTLCQEACVTDDILKMAQVLSESKSPTIMLGRFALMHPQASLLQSLCIALSDMVNAKVGMLTVGANTSGAWMAGVLPHRGPAGACVKQGMNVQQMWQQALKTYVLFGVEPELESAQSNKALQALKNANCVIAMSSFVTDSMREYAHVILPIASFGETSGTLMNIEKTWQSFHGAVLPIGEARPAWKVLRVLGNLFELEGFDYISSEEVLAELKILHAQVGVSERSNPLPATLSYKETKTKGLQRITDMPMFAVDMLTRQSEPLQKMLKAEKVSCVRLNANMAQIHKVQAGHRLNLRQAGQELKLEAAIDERVPDHCILLNMGIHETAGFGEAFGEIEITDYRG